MTINITVQNNVVTATISGIGPQGLSGESGVIVESGSSYTVTQAKPGVPFNVVVRKASGSATLIELPNPNPAAPWSRVNVFDGKGDSNANPITVADTNGTIFVIETPYESLAFVDDGTTWNIQ